ncbi:F-box protein-like protein [Tanacetum coccineum]
MSDNIPFDMQMEIIIRVSDVKSLIRFRAVSKPWKSFIESSEFTASYRARKTQPQTLLIRYIDNSNAVKYLSVNNDTFLTQQKDLAPNVSSLMKQLRYLRVIGYSRGLLCLRTFEKGGMLVLWNPSLRRSVATLVSGYFDVFGFAVSSVANEPTIVMMSYSHWKVKIFTLSSKRWTEIQCRKPRESITLHDRSHVVIGSCIYRVASETISLLDDYFTPQYMIMSFDLIAKELKAIDLPDKITDAFPTPIRFILSKLKGSLVVIVPHRQVKVWKMEPDCSFTQLFTINTPDSYITDIVGFRKNGELLVETKEWRGWPVLYNRESALEVYDPCSKQITNLGISGQNGTFFVSSYKETLLLLDHSDSCEYPEIN